jgi:hypothetical protein
MHKTKKGSKVLAGALGTIVAIFGAGTGNYANAQTLINGTYSGPEESFVVMNGTLSKCYLPGPDYGSCRGIVAKQVGSNAIHVTCIKGGGRRDYCAMSALKCKGKLPPGKDGFSARCTRDGWQ